MAKQILIIENIGREIKIMRKHKQWTQEYLAEKSGVSMVTIGKIENEEILPEVQTAKKIIAAFGMDYEIHFALVDTNKSITSEIPKKKKRF